MNKYYELKDPQTFETVFFGSEKECEAFCENPDNNITFEWWPIEDLNRYRRKKHANDGSGNRSQL